MIVVRFYSAIKYKDEKRLTVPTNDISELKQHAIAGPNLDIDM